MLKAIVTIICLISAIVPIYAVIELRDTTPILQCDTIVEKNGVVSPVIIKSVSHSFVTYTQCSDGAKKKYSIGTSKIRELKSKTFALLKSEPKPLTSKAKTWFILSIISAGLFFFTFGQPSILLIVSPILLAISLFSNGTILNKAKKENKKRATRLANMGMFIILLVIFVKLALISK